MVTKSGSGATNSAHVAGVVVGVTSSRRGRTERRSPDTLCGWSSNDQWGIEMSQTQQRDELRTVAFRLREIQRLLSVRAEQENRRLEAEGLEPVSESAFFKPYEPGDDDS